jgi:hypothetical protein
VGGHRGTRDQGTISIFVAIGATMMLMFVGLVVDAGGELRAIVNADAVAQEAARVGGEQIDKVLLFQKGEYWIDTAAAYKAVNAYLQTMPGYQEFVQQPPQLPADVKSITVEIHPSYQTSLLGLVGVSSLKIKGTGTATLVVGNQNGVVS